MTDSTIIPFTDSIWTMEQPSNFLGVPLGLRMTIIRLTQQQLIIHSAIPYSEKNDALIQALGEVRYLIAPNLEHTRFINEWRQRYPNAQLYAPSAVSFDYNVALEDNNSPLSQHSDLFYLKIDGMPRLQEFVFFHPQSQTLILTDLAFNLGKAMSLWGRTFLQLNGAYQRFTPSRILKSMIKDEDAFCNSLQQVQQWDFKQIIIAHGTPITDNAKERFNQAFKWAL